MANAPPEPGLRRPRHPHAGPRHRRHDDDLHRRQRRAAAAAALSRAGSAREPLGRLRRRRAVAAGDVARRLSRLPAAQPVVRDAGRRLRRAGRRRHGRADGARRRTRARRRVARHGELPAAPRRGSDLRPPLHRRGRDAGRTAGRHPQPRLVEAALRRRSRHRRQRHPARRSRSDRRRRDARRVPAVAAVGSVPDHRLADLEAAAVQLRQPAAAQLHLLHGVRPAEAGRHVRAGAGGSCRRSRGSCAPSTRCTKRRACRSASCRSRTTSSSTRGGRSWRCSWRSASCC